MTTRVRSCGDPSDKITQEDLENCLPKGWIVRPTGLDEYLVENPKGMSKDKRLAQVTAIKEYVDIHIMNASSEEISIIVNCLKQIGLSEK